MDREPIKYVLFIYFSLIANAFAGTDLLSNALTQSNTFLKEAGNVQREYSKEFRKIATMKVNPDALLGEKGRAIKEKAEKAIDKANSLKEKAEKIKKVAEQAQAEGAALMEKYNKLNEQAAELKSQAEDTLAKGREIQDKYKTGKAKLEEVLDAADDIKNKIKDEEEGEDIYANTNDNGEADRGESDDNFADAIAVETNVSEDNGFRKVIGFNPSQNVSAGSAGKIITEETIGLNQLPTTINGSHVKRQIYNQADAISSAGSMAKQVESQASIVDIDTGINLDDINQNTVSVSDVVRAVNNPEGITSPPKGDGNIHTAQSFKTQLEQVSNYARSTENRSYKEEIKVDDQSEIINSNYGASNQFRTAFENERQNDDAQNNKTKKINHNVSADARDQFATLQDYHDKEESQFVSVEKALSNLEVLKKRPKDDDVFASEECAEISNVVDRIVFTGKNKNDNEMKKAFKSLIRQETMLLLANTVKGEISEQVFRNEYATNMKAGIVKIQDIKNESDINSSEEGAKEFLIQFNIVAKKGGKIEVPVSNLEGFYKSSSKRADELMKRLNVDSKARVQAGIKMNNKIDFEEKTNE